MKTDLFFNQLGFAPNVTPRQSRVDSLSIVSRQSDLRTRRAKSSCETFSVGQCSPHAFPFEAKSQLASSHQSDLRTFVGRLAAILLLCLTVGVGQMWGTEHLLISGASGDPYANNAPWGTSYGSSTGTTTTSAGTSISLTYVNVGRMSSGIQIKANTSNTFYSTTCPTNNIIKSILIVNATNSANLYGSTNGSTWTSISYTSGTAVNVSSYNYKYFKITATSKYCVLSRVMVVYTEDDSCGKFYESFYSFNKTGGNDGSWSGTAAGTGVGSTVYTDNTGWSFGSYGYVGDECVRMGTSSYAGVATTPSIPVTSGKKYKLKYRAGAWGSDACTITVSASGASVTTAVSPSGALSTSSFTDYTATLTASASSMTITFTGTAKKRYFLDEVCVEEESSCSATPTIGNASINSSLF